MQQTQMYHKTASQKPGNTGAIQRTPIPKLGFKSLTDKTKGAYVGRTSVICKAALQSGNFYLGIACTFLLIVVSILVNQF